MDSSDVITDPDLKKRYETLVADWAQPQADGHSLFLKLKEILLEQEEKNFEADIAGLPYIVTLPKPRWEAEWAAHEDWLKANTKGRYLSFPNNAAGKYMSAVFNVYFERHQDATFYKLSKI